MRFNVFFVTKLNKLFKIIITAISWWCETIKMSSNIAISLISLVTGMSTLQNVLLCDLRRWNNEKSLCYLLLKTQRKIQSPTDSGRVLGCIVSWNTRVYRPQRNSCWRRQPLARGFPVFSDQTIKLYLKSKTNFFFHGVAAFLFCFQTMSGIDSTIIETPFGLWNRNLADTLVITSCGFSKNSRDELFCITGFFVSHHIFCITTLWTNCSSKFDPVLRNAMRFASNSKHSSPSESSLLCSKASKIQQASFQGSTECGSIVLVAFPRT